MIILNCNLNFILQILVYLYVFYTDENFYHPSR